MAAAWRGAQRTMTTRGHTICLWSKNRFSIEGFGDVVDDFHHLGKRVRNPFRPTTHGEELFLLSIFFFFFFIFFFFRFFVFLLLLLVPFSFLGPSISLWRAIIKMNVSCVRYRGTVVLWARFSAGVVKHSWNNRKSTNTQSRWLQLFSLLRPKKKPSRVYSQP